jgi:hypothetical protein
MYVTPFSEGFGIITIARANGSGMASAAAERRRAIAMASAKAMAARMVVGGRPAATCRPLARPAGAGSARHVCRVG